MRFLARPKPKEPCPLVLPQIVLSCVNAFVDGGPMVGNQVKAGGFLASTDRVATDAVGVAIVKSPGSNAAITKRTIFEQEQRARAV